MPPYQPIAIPDKDKLIQAGTSMRQAGVSCSPFDSLNLADHVGDQPEAVIRNRHLFFKQIGLGLSHLVYCRQIHSNRVILVDQAASPPGTPTTEAAAMISTQPGIILGVFTADCVPIFILDAATPAVGIVHAGWRGTLGRIAEKTVQAMQCHFGTSPSNCFAHLGPSIQKCCYTVSQELADKFERAHDASVRSNGNRLSLQNANVQQLTQIGVPLTTISVAPFCTACRTDLFYSHRAEGGQTGRMLSFITLIIRNW